MLLSASAYRVLTQPEPRLPTILKQAVALYSAKTPSNHHSGLINPVRLMVKNHTGICLWIIRRMLAPHAMITRGMV